MQMKQIATSNVDVRQMIEQGAQFHGHLGPYLVAGIKMGLLALAELGSNGHKDLFAKVETGTEPPLSCLADGIQISTGCTLGKGNIKVIDKGIPRGEFRTEERSLKIKLKPNYLESLDGEGLEEKAWNAFTLNDEELFTWTSRR